MSLLNGRVVMLPHRKYPLLRDPYESRHVFVQQSAVLPDGRAGEGLFAKVFASCNVWRITIVNVSAVHHWTQVFLPAGRIAAWYNGIRVPCEEVDGRPDWSLNDNVRLCATWRTIRWIIYIMCGRS